MSYIEQGKIAPKQDVTATYQSVEDATTPKQNVSVTFSYR